MEKHSVNRIRLPATFNECLDPMESHLVSEFRHEDSILFIETCRKTFSTTIKIAAPGYHIARRNVDRDHPLFKSKAQML